LTKRWILLRWSITMKQIYVFKNILDRVQNYNNVTVIESYELALIYQFGCVSYEVLNTV
jgi:hypothetical protein